jgi:hypothetical protein
MGEKCSMQKRKKKKTGVGDRKIWPWVPWCPEARRTLKANINSYLPTTSSKE